MKEKEKKHCHCHENENCGCAEGKECNCGENCTCGEGCTCHEEDSCKGITHEHECHCGHEHHHGECSCSEHCECEEGECHCHENCECDEGCDENCDCECHDHERVNQYLAMAQRLQADFDNYRKHVAEQLDLHREMGRRSVIEVFLPCLDTFKEAKKSISDEGVLAGVTMIEEKIINALKDLKVEKIESVGHKFDHNLHEVIAVFANPEQEDDIILEEYQAGWKMNGKVIRYAKVVVNKLS
ncbi:MAG: nucleotide exchange factor GrpE [Clostridia bacterium]|nr:nucleotide exchange factor GrpE [Clostridia bacterium]